jgi:hypothetical protein
MHLIAIGPFLVIFSIMMALTARIGGAATSPASDVQVGRSRWRMR